MEEKSGAVVDVFDNIRLVGTAHIRRTSADLVKEHVSPLCQVMEPSSFLDQPWNMG